MWSEKINLQALHLDCSVIIHMPQDAGETPTNLTICTQVPHSTNLTAVFPR